MDRRFFLKSTPGLGAGLLAAQTQTGQAPGTAKRTVRLKQTVTRGVFGRGAVFEDTCRLAADLGFKGYDLAYPEDWPTLKKYGLVSTMSYVGPAAPPPAGRRGAPGGQAGRGGVALAAAPNRFRQATGPNVANGIGPSRPSSMQLNIRENHDEQEKLLNGAIDNCAANGFPNIIVFSGNRVPGGMVIRRRPTTASPS